MLGGAIYEFFRLPRILFPKLPLRIALDLLFSVCFSALFLLISVKNGFPGFRSYMFLGILAGFLLYAKTFHKIVAIPIKMVYNKYTDTVRKHSNGKSKDD